MRMLLPVSLYASGKACGCYDCTGIPTWSKKIAGRSATGRQMARQRQRRWEERWWRRDWGLRPR